MKKPVFCLFIVCCALTFFSVSHSRILLQKNSVIKGKTILPKKIKSCSVWEYALKFGVQEEYGRQLETTAYDSMGHLVFSEVLLPNGNSREITAHQYDTSWNILKTFTYQSYLDSVDSMMFFKSDSLILVTEEEKLVGRDLVNPLQVITLDSNEVLPLKPGGGVAMKTLFLYDESKRINERTTNRKIYDSLDIVELYQFDTIRHLISPIVLSIEDSIKKDSLALTDSEAMMLADSEDSRFVSDSLDYVTKIQYDETGKKTEELITVNNKPNNSMSYKYDTQGRRVEKLFYTNEGAVVYKLDYRYTPQGKLADEVEYDNNGKVIYKTLYKYDAKGNLIDASRYDTNRTAHEQLLRKYDNRGFKLEETKYDNYGQLSYLINYTYNQNGDIAEQKIYYKDTHKPKFLRRYKYEYYLSDEK